MYRQHPHQYVPVLLSPHRPSDVNLVSGEAMMAMRATDIDTVYARLQELDAKILLHPMKSPDGIQIELVVHDPDGTRVHVVERPDGPFDSGALPHHLARVHGSRRIKCRFQGFHQVQFDVILVVLHLNDFEAADTVLG
jgi:hypothetical protein